MCRIVHIQKYLTTNPHPNLTHNDLILMSYLCYVYNDIVSHNITIGITSHETYITNIFTMH